MGAETLVYHHPPTPPNVSIELQSGIHQIAQYNADRSYSFDESHSHGSAYGSPIVHNALPQHHTQSLQLSHDDGHLRSDFELGIQYDNYGSGSGFYQEGHFNGLPNNPGMFSGSPPTPTSVTDNDDSTRRATRSGSSNQGADSKPKPKPAAKPKKAKTGKSEKPKTPKLTAPLSVLTKDFTSIPVRNIEEWVNRSAKTRREEAEKRNGYVTRPMNSFMLYRSAYAERTKQWCLQNNHQVVSSVSGESWPMEPPEVRELYNEYAKIERINHQSAHPTYKFSPSKPSPPGRKPKRGYFDDESSDVDDGEWAPGNTKRYKTSKKQNRDLGYSTNGVNTEFFDGSYGMTRPGLNRSAWEMSNEGRPMPMPIQNDMYNQYFQTSVHPNLSMGTAVLEDLRMRRVQSPGTSMQFSTGHNLIGLPGGHPANLLQHLHSHVGTPLGEDGQVDPMLLAFDGNHHELEHTITPHSEYQIGGMETIDRELDHDSVNSLIGVGIVHEDFKPEHWQPEPSMSPMEQGSEFEKWMDDHHTC